MGQQEDRPVALQAPVQVREHRALAAACAACHARAPGCAVLDRGMGDSQELTGEVLSADKVPGAVLYELGQGSPLRLLPGGQRLLGELASLGLQVAPEVLEHLLAPGLQTRDPLPCLVPSCAVVPDPGPQLRVPVQAGLEGLQGCSAGRGARIGAVGVAVPLGQFRRHPVIGQRVAEVGEAPPPLLGRLLEDAVLDLQGRDAPPLDLAGEAGLLGSGCHAVLRRDPPVAVAQQDQQEGPAPLDLVEADLQDQQLAGLFVAGPCGLHTDPQVDRLEDVATPAKLLLQAREDMVPQLVAFRVHIAKRAADEDRSRPPPRCHQLPFPAESSVRGQRVQLYVPPEALSTREYGSARGRIAPVLTYRPSRALGSCIPDKLLRVGNNPAALGSIHGLGYSVYQQFMA